MNAAHTQMRMGGQDTHRHTHAQQKGFAVNDLDDARTPVIWPVHLPFIGVWIRPGKGTVRLLRISLPNSGKMLVTHSTVTDPTMEAGQVAHRELGYWNAR